MCGIFGAITSPESTSSEKKFSHLQHNVETLFAASLSRGSEAAGLAVVSQESVPHTTIAKVSQKAPHFLKSRVYRSLVKKIESVPTIAIIGHARLATNGSHKIDANNQPVVSRNKNIIGVHNGIITNFEELYKKLQKIDAKTKHSTKKMPELDTQVALDYLEFLLYGNAKNSTKSIPINDENIKKAIKKILSEMEGTVNFALLFPKQQKAVLATNNGSLYLQKIQGVYYFASESVFFENIIHTSLHNKPVQVLPNTVSILDFSHSPTQPEKRLAKPGIEIITLKQSSHSHFKNDLKKLRKHTINYEKIASIPRCTKCILPATTPFISFNNEGICSYCTEHEPINYKGRDALEPLLAKYRKNNSEHDCLVAFSGGRDSSYGLHLIKKELGMNPLAFTYDWGMISELGRRNQARVLQKLEVEHILVSADIEMKRRHIRENILAWMKNPHLGMVPLFMQGDKQCEYYADQIMKKYNIPLMIYCRGNELEKDEFKTGHCGVKDADPGGVIHNLAATNKAKLLAFYGLQYLKNPAYINSSFFETAFGYFSTYIQPHDYAYLWHYLPWKEDKIIQTLTQEYNWELSPDTPTSWRIGDGSPAFYNYIYYQVQGFTENDSLRARQVREGIITRQQALDLVRGENAPQYNNLKWYFDTLELDGDVVLSVVDAMKKLY